MTKAVVVLDMVGTWNALKKPLEILRNRHRWEMRYAATNVAASAMQKDEIPLLDSQKSAQDALRGFKPDLVITGISPSAPDLERRYGLAALDLQIPVVMYRDYSGVASWVREVAAYYLAKKLLHFLMFDEATVEVVRRNSWPCAEARAVGSSYYDDLVNYDVGAARAKARDTLGLTANDRLLLYSGGSDAPRVLESLTPIVSGLMADPKISSLVFAPTFHPKDKDAPFQETETKGVYAPKASAAYDPILDALAAEGEHWLIREPIIRNSLPDSKMRLAAADFVIMNALSTDTWTTAFLRVPMLIPLLPLQARAARESNIAPDGFDLINKGAAAAVYTAEDLTDYIRRLKTYEFKTMADVLRKAQEEFKPKCCASDAIVEALLTVVKTPL
jgi:hypothetical protein